MTDIIAAEFIPWEINPKRPNLKCHRHDRYCSRGIYSVEKNQKHQIQNAIGMTGIVAAEFIPWIKIQTPKSKMP
ncbi:hypothetical protein [Dyadobacter sp. 3J3]|uniref:hypothetical protein n=1 Tax=Dyadobacter sp. 3J3 TaxID=2606600 RepID=UPI001357129F|nr:hypothetical protein [Dyadobacter sp. 3J3]